MGVTERRKQDSTRKSHRDTKPFHYLQKDFHYCLRYQRIFYDFFGFRLPITEHNSQFLEFPYFDMGCHKRLSEKYGVMRSLV